METCAVLLIGEMRKEHVKTASILQAVVKHGSSHEDVGTTGIKLVLETLKKLAVKYRGQEHHTLSLEFLQ